MKDKNRFTLQTLITCILIIGALAAAYYFAASFVLQEISRHLGPIGTEGVETGTQGPLIQAVKDLLGRIQPYLVYAIAAPAGLAVLLLWLIVQGLGRRAINRAAAAARPLVAPPAAEAKARKEPLRYSPAPAVQLLSILQRQGRFIDFLQEDLKVYDDAQIGAAVRSIQEGCKQALFDHVKLEPVFKQEEGTEVTIQPDFDAYSIRLTGNVVGNPPFRGAIRHRGWRVLEIDLPKQMEDREHDRIIAPAEVEVTS